MARLCEFPGLWAPGGVLGARPLTFPIAKRSKKQSGSEAIPDGEVPRGSIEEKYKATPLKKLAPAGLCGLCA